MLQKLNRPPFANSGFGYFMKGFELIKMKGIRRFVFVPLTVNLLLFSFAFYHLFKQLDIFLSEFQLWLPDSLTWLTSLIWPIAVLFLIVLSSFIFSAIANWIAAPFNGLLAEKIESRLTNTSPSSDTLVGIIKDTPRTLNREWCKFKYYLPRALVFLLLYWLLPIVGQVLWLLFLAWMMAVQYKDYAFDNHKVGFNEMKNALKQHKKLSFSFGITAALFSMIPVINLVVMPVAICGATALWVDTYRNEFVK